MPDDWPPKGYVPYSTVGGFSDPATAPDRLVDFAGKALVPASGMTITGEAAGLAARTLLGPEWTYVPGLIDAGVAGLTNIGLSKKLPQAIGGQPEHSAAYDFAMGAGPSAVVGTGLAAYGQHAARKAAETSLDEYLERLREVSPSAAEQVERASGAINRPIERPPENVGEAQTDEVNTLRSNLLKPIQRERKTIGEPIGQAYEGLKGSKTLAPVEDLGAQTKGILSSSRAPITPRTQRLLARGKALMDRLKPPKAATGLEDMDIGLPGGEFIKQGSKPPTVKDLRLQGYNDNQILKILGQTQKKKWKPPTLDELRRLRQDVEVAQRSATGSDWRALSLYKKEIDKRLDPFLTPEIGRQRELYAGFMKRFPYRDLNQLKSLGTAEEVGTWMSKLKPPQLLEVIRAAKPAERDALIEGWKSNILRQVNPNQSYDQIAASIRNAMQESVANGTAQELFGAAAGKELAAIFHIPDMAKTVTEMMTRPSSQDAYVNAFMKAYRAGDQDAANAGIAALVESLRPAEQRALQAMGPRGVQLPVGVTTQQALEMGLKDTSGKGIAQYGANRAKFAFPMGVGRMAMGSSGGASYSLGTLFAYLSLMLGASGWKAAMANGGATGLSKLLSSKTGSAVGEAFFKLLVQMGTRAMQAKRYKPEEGAQP